MQRGIGRLRAGGNNPLGALISALFGAGANGAAYEGDVGSGFQDSAATTALYAPGAGSADAPVGRRSDKSGNTNHALQATTTSRPLLSARVNWITKTELLTDAAWVGSNRTVAASANPDPNGTFKAFSVTATAINGTLYQPTSTAITGVNVLWVRRVTGSGALTLYAPDGGTGTVITGSVTTSWQKFTSSQATGSFGPQIVLGTSGDVVEVAFPQANCGLTVAPYQRVVDASTYDTAGIPLYDKADGIDDSWTSATGGGGSTGFFWCGSVQVFGGAGGSRSIWSDTGTNTGYRVRIASTNKLAIGAGNGTAFTSATTTDNVDAGNTYVLTVWDDGVNLNAQVNLGGVVSVARPVVSAGTAGFTVAAENGSATLYASVGFYAQFYQKNGNVSAATRLSCQRYCASKAGISI